MGKPVIINKFGRMTGWNSITLNMLGRDVEGITAIKYNDKVAKENAYGANKFPIGRGEGNYEPTCSLTLYKEEVDGLNASLPPGMRIQDIPPFDITVEYENTAQSGIIQKDVIHNCEFTDRAIDVKQADGTIAPEYTLICSHIDWNI